jgi:hypothetical protein
VFSPIASNLVEQGFSMVNPLHTLDFDGDPLRVVLIDNAAYSDEVLTTPGRDQVDTLATLGGTPLRCQRMLRRIDEVAFAHTSMGARAVVSRPTQPVQHQDPLLGSCSPQ